MPNMRLFTTSLALAGALLAAPIASAHDSWISSGGHRNAAGEWCCGEGDCFMLPRSSVKLTFGGYVITGSQIVDGVEKAYTETVPFSEAQPSPDGEYWRCKRPDGTRRCFFAPPPAY